MQYFVILTKECNLLCSYCGGGSDTPPAEMQYSVQELKAFLARDPDPVVEFYGGEPLLRVKEMLGIMEAIPARFAIQTNGLLLDRLDGGSLSKLHTILVSVDGTRETTDGERGRGVYERATRNAALARERGFRGDLIARMTVEQGYDVEEGVRHLLATGLFDHVHWQLSFSMFWGPGSEPGPGPWLRSYNDAVKRLVSWWVSEMERTGEVAGIVPFIGVMGSLLSGRPSGLRCGSGVDFFAIVPDGTISACPVSVDFDFSTVGSVRESNPESLRGSCHLGEPCSSCSILGICGGRCLFVNRSQGLLRPGGYEMICGTVRSLVGSLQEALPKVKGLVAAGTVDAATFDYPEFNNGCEVIP